MQSTPTPKWISALWRDIASGEAMPQSFDELARTGYRNLPAFLKRFCYLYYKKNMDLQRTAASLRIGERLARQRWVVSMSLFRILLASKPKNPV